MTPDPVPPDPSPTPDNYTHLTPLWLAGQNAAHRGDPCRSPPHLTWQEAQAWLLGWYGHTFTKPQRRTGDKAKTKTEALGVSLGDTTHRRARGFCGPAM